jgi:hypothetical protein
VRAVDETLVVLEVASQAHAAEDRLLELAVEHVEGAVDADARLLLLDGPAIGMQPVHGALVALHRRQQAVDRLRRVVGGPALHADIDALFDNGVRLDVDRFHARGGARPRVGMFVFTNVYECLRMYYKSYKVQRHAPRTQLQLTVRRPL